MAWLVFGLFFLASDNAPWWVYVLFVLGFLYDLRKEHMQELRTAK